MSLVDELRGMLASPLPLPGSGQTSARHHSLFEIGRRSLSLARLVEAHWDAVAILADAGREAVPGAIYGVWAAESPEHTLRITQNALSGKKPFCSGAGLIDRALVSVAEPERRLIDVNLRQSGLTYDHSQWRTSAFFETNTSTVMFDALQVSGRDCVCTGDFYLGRPGFWHGACGPAACWAGGAAGLVDWAAKQSRNDPHTLAHLGAMRSNLWALETLLNAAGAEIDGSPHDESAAHVRALRLRHLVEVHATDTLRRLARAYGPHPLAFDEAVSMRYQELDLYLRQSHGERDLNVLGKLERQ